MHSMMYLFQSFYLQVYSPLTHHPFSLYKGFRYSFFSYNLEEQMLKDFFKKLNMSTKQKTKGEIVAGTLTGIATAIL